MLPVQAYWYLYLIFFYLHTLLKLSYQRPEKISKNLFFYFFFIKININLRDQNLKFWIEAPIIWLQIIPGEEHSIHKTGHRGAPYFSGSI